VLGFSLSGWISNNILGFLMEPVLKISWNLYFRDIQKAGLW